MNNQRGFGFESPDDLNWVVEGARKAHRSHRSTDVSSLREVSDTECFVKVTDVKNISANAYPGVFWFRRLVDMGVNSSVNGEPCMVEDVNGRTLVTDVVYKGKVYGVKRWGLGSSQKAFYVEVNAGEALSVGMTGFDFEGGNNNYSQTNWSAYWFQWTVSDPGSGGTTPPVYRIAMSSAGAVPTAQSVADNSVVVPANKKVVVTGSLFGHIANYIPSGSTRYVRMGIYARIVVVDEQGGLSLSKDADNAEFTYLTAFAPVVSTQTFLDNTAGGGVFYHFGDTQPFTTSPMRVDHRGGAPFWKFLRTGDKPVRLAYQVALSWFMYPTAVSQPAMNFYTTSLGRGVGHLAYVEVTEPNAVVLPVPENYTGTELEGTPGLQLNVPDGALVGSYPSDPYSSSEDAWMFSTITGVRVQVFLENGVWIIRVWSSTDTTGIPSIYFAESQSTDPLTINFGPVPELGSSGDVILTIAP